MSHTKQIQKEEDLLFESRIIPVMKYCENDKDIEFTGRVRIITEIITD
jgi:hypothetical protein